MKIFDYSVAKIISVLTTTSALFYTGFSHAEEHSVAHQHSDVHEHMHDHGDNPTLAKIMFDQLEVRDGDGENPFVVEAQAWIGKDLDKFWLKVDVDQSKGKTNDAELQALYSRAIASYWDLQLGVRQDIKPEPTSTWGAIGFHGLAPYFFEVDTGIYVGESGSTAARFSAEYECLFTQRLILSPEVTVNFYGQTHEDKMTGSGLSDISTGLRLRYEIAREFAPYIGVHWSKKYGNTANFYREKNETTSDSEFVVGLRAWF